MTRERTQELTSSYRNAFYSEPSKRSCMECFCDWLCNFVYVVLMALGVFYLWTMMGRPNMEEAGEFVKNFDVSDFTNVLENITDSIWDRGFDEDPYMGDNTTSIWKRATASGLALVVLNALDDNWQTEFAAAVADWEESEVLELTAIEVKVDHNCSIVEGYLKVCNGNFGETGWVGINEIILEFASAGDKGYIVASVAKMNEFYLMNAAYDQRQYTMCHEIGHGFGLPHTDETFDNADTGNCLDYTLTPANNLHPGEVNMNRLKSMYGYSSRGTNSKNDDNTKAADDYTSAGKGAVTDDVFTDDSVYAVDDAIFATDDASYPSDDNLNGGRRNGGGRNGGGRGLHSGRGDVRRLRVIQYFRYVPRKD